jgi:hypothetical protein
MENKIMKKWNLSLYLPVITLIIGTLIGSGAFWQYENLTLEKDQTAKEYRDYRFKLLQHIISLSNEYNTAVDSYYKLQNPDTLRKIEQLITQLDVLTNDFKTLESSLSKLENRAPEKILIRFILPMKPMNVTATLKKDDEGATDFSDVDIPQKRK